MNGSGRPVRKHHAYGDAYGDGLAGLAGRARGEADG